MGQGRTAAGRMQSRDRWECGEGTGVESTDRVWRSQGSKTQGKRATIKPRSTRQDADREKQRCEQQLIRRGRRAGKLFWAISRQPEMRWEKSDGGDGDTEGRRRDQTDDEMEIKMEMEMDAEERRDEARRWTRMRDEKKRKKKKKKAEEATGEARDGLDFLPFVLSFVLSRPPFFTLPTPDTRTAVLDLCVSRQAMHSSLTPNYRLTMALFLPPPIPCSPARQDS